MRPQDGDIACTGPQVTDESCLFTCELGYQLIGSDNQTCLPDNTWSGEPVSCMIMSCPQLQEPFNGAIVLPCSHAMVSCIKSLRYMSVGLTYKYNDSCCKAFQYILYAHKMMKIITFYISCSY